MIIGPGAGALNFFARPAGSHTNHEARPAMQLPAVELADLVDLRSAQVALAPRGNPAPKSFPIEGFAWTPDGKMVSTESPSLVGTPARLRLWEPGKSAEPVNFDVHRPNVRIGSVAASPDGELVAVGWDDGKFSVFSARGAEINYGEHCPTSVPDAQGILRDLDDVRAVAFSPDSRTLATAGQDGRLVLWDAQGRESFGTLLHPDRVTDVAFTPDSSKIVTRFRGGLAIWDAREQRLIHRLEDTRKEGQGGMALSPDGSKVATVFDKVVKVFDVSTGEELHSQPVRWSGKLAFTPDGNHVLVGENIFNAVHDWNLTTGECHRHALPQAGGYADAQGISQLSVSKDGRHLAVGLMDSSLTLWKKDDHSSDLGFLADATRTSGPRLGDFAFVSQFRK